MNDPAATNTGPGFLAFVTFFVLALVLWFLMKNMNARMRRMSYRQQAAHRGEDEPQVTESELSDGAGGDVGAEEPSATPGPSAATGQTPQVLPPEDVADGLPESPGGPEGGRG